MGIFLFAREFMINIQRLSFLLKVLQYSALLLLHRQFSFLDDERIFYREKNFFVLGRTSEEDLSIQSCYDTVIVGGLIFSRIFFCQSFFDGIDDLCLDKYIHFNGRRFVCDESTEGFMSYECIQESIGKRETAGSFAHS